jgi:hypothetical protein
VDPVPDCGLVVRVSGYKSIPNATRYFEKYWVWKGVHSLVGTIEELLERKSRGSGLEIREYGSGDPSR